MSLSITFFLNKNVQKDDKHAICGYHFNSLDDIYEPNYMNKATYDLHGMNDMDCNHGTGSKNCNHGRGSRDTRDSA